MALDDIVFPETDICGFLDEIAQSNFTGSVYDIVFNKDEIEELVLTAGGGGETSYVF